MAEVEVTSNLPELKSHLDRIGKEFAGRVMRNATAAAARVFRTRAANLAPVLQKPAPRRTAGTLRRAMVIKRSKDRTSGREHYFVGFRRGRDAAKKGRDAFYGYFLEAGWKPRGPGKKLRGGNRSRALQRRSSAGQEIMQYRFLRPAFESGKSEALAKFFAAADKNIARLSAQRTPT